MVETQNKEVKVQNNSREVDWVLQQVNEELIKLDEGIKATNEARNLFIKKNSDTQEEVFDIDLAEKYLEGLKDKSWGELSSSNSAAWIMAVQIVLKSEGYEVGNIDGMLGNATKVGVRDFQRRHGLKVDGLPGSATIKALLGGVVSPINEIYSEEILDKRKTIIKDLSLSQDPKNELFYTRSGYSGKYVFDDKGTLFYLGDNKLLPQRYDEKTKNWIEDNSFVISLVVSELNLRKIDSGFYARDGYPGTYSFDVRGSLHYSGHENSLPQKYNYITKNWTPEFDNRSLVSQYSLKLDTRGFYTNSRSGIYAFDSNGNLFYRSDKEGNQKLENGKRKQKVSFGELPAALKTIDATIQVLSLKKDGDNYVRDGYNGKYTFNNKGQLSYSGSEKYTTYADGKRVS
ncbi:MAG: peptidoglycan-binding domain-containing protein [Candidatus Absconditabacteria bacterium]|nr:peptidoglycan-binding domain-containing protein [Candidatus Absconditabacteria bacterium]MDD3868744.1 peptidoglycan-binding domain-containing protein [Candidatus Absconditabacteria bacterium]MDD4714373.1 peptidoglycan-binding domain-containing protein [Candidatus Absconditabacteria bacterium]